MILVQREQVPVAGDDELGFGGERTGERVIIIGIGEDGGCDRGGMHDGAAADKTAEAADAVSAFAERHADTISDVATATDWTSWFMSPPQAPPPGFHEGPLGTWTRDYSPPSSEADNGIQGIDRNNPCAVGASCKTGSGFVIYQ